MNLQLLDSLNQPLVQHYPTVNVLAFIETLDISLIDSTISKYNKPSSCTSDATIESVTSCATMGVLVREGCGRLGREGDGQSGSGVARVGAWVGQVGMVTLTSLLSQ